ncbi:MAG TPA: hypothetical protein VJI46_01580 [Candidatus Nanoarchaeia archaeon]|nr:hypothetical protein [Candidatus Nanoarchaeia archaeon]
MEEEKAHIRAKAIIEVLGKPKEHVEKAIRAYVEKIKTDGGFVILKEDYADAEEKSALWSTFVELDMVAGSITELIGFCFDYMPSSIDIIKPEYFTISSRELNAVMNDLQAKLHNVDMVAKNRAAETDFLKRNLKTMTENTIALILAYKNCSLDEISSILKIEREELVPIVDGMEKNDKVKKEGEKYSLHGKQGKD